MKRMLFAVTITSVLLATAYAQSEVVENWIASYGKSGFKSREIFLYVPEKEFTEKSIRERFLTYQAEYCDPYILNIYAYSDLEMLKKRIHYEKNPGVAIDFRDTAEGRASAHKYYTELLGPDSGYLRGQYSRYGGYEFFDFSPAKDDPAMTRIYIRNKDSGYPFIPNPCQIK